MIKRLISWYKNLPANVKGMLIMGIVLLVAIVISRERIWEAVKKGFMFFNRQRRYSSRHRKMQGLWSLRSQLPYTNNCPGKTS